MSARERMKSATRRTGWLRLAATLCMILAPAGPATAIPGDAGSTAAEFLRLNAGAAAVAQGEAMTARSGTIHAFPYNPAGIARATDHQLTLQYNSYFSDMSTGYIGGLWAGPRFRVAGSVNYWSGGEQSRRTITNPTGSLGTFSNNAFMLALGAAYPLDNGISLGATLKGFEESLDQVSRSGVAADLGFHYRRPGNWWELGAAVRHLGSAVTFDRNQEDLPLEFAVGGSVLSWGDRLRVSGEVALPRRQDADWMFGAEFLATRSLPLRIGWNSRNEIGNGLSAGAGFRHEHISVDYSWTDYNVIGDAHRIALNVAFGSDHAPEDYQAERQSLPGSATIPGAAPQPASSRAAERGTAAGSRGTPASAAPGKPGGDPVASTPSQPGASRSVPAATPRVLKEPPRPLPPRVPVSTSGAAPSPSSRVETRANVTAASAPDTRPASGTPRPLATPPVARPPANGDWRVSGTTTRPY